MFRVSYQVINLKDLQGWDQGAVVEPESLRKSRIIRHANQPIKVLGEGTLESSLTIKAHAFSTSAREKIEAAGGTVEVIR